MLISKSSAAGRKLKTGDRIRTQHKVGPKAEFWTYLYSFDAAHRREPNAQALQILANRILILLKRNKIYFGEAIPALDKNFAKLMFPGCHLGPTAVEAVIREVDTFMETSGWQHLKVSVKPNASKSAYSLYVVMVKNDARSMLYDMPPEYAAAYAAAYTHLTSTSASDKRDPRKYRWMQYDGRKATFHVVGQDKEEYDLALEKGEKIGVKKHRGFTYLVDASDLSLQLKLKPEDAKRIVNNSKAYSGKVGRYKVMPYDGGKDKVALRSDKKDSAGVIHLIADSSMFSAVMFDPAKGNLFVRFKNGAIWEYTDVTLKEARSMERASSQGKWFNRKIKGLKPETRVNKLPKGFAFR